MSKGVWGTDLGHFRLQCDCNVFYFTLSTNLKSTDANAH